MLMKFEYAFLCKVIVVISNSLKSIFMKNIFLFGLVLLFLSCNNEEVKHQLKNGMYKVELDVQDNEQLPFIIEVTSPGSLKAFNAEEVIDIDEVVYKGDSIYINFPVFRDYLAIKVVENGNWSGFYISPDRDRKVNLKATFKAKNRFESNNKPEEDVTGVWETVFSKGIPGDEYIAKGIFKQHNERVTGTFRTTTGDYRYLEGIMDGDTMKLSTFDGAHAFLFTAKVNDSTMEGTFYSGKHWKELFVAKRNTDYELTSANELTFLKEGYERFEFSFPNSVGEQLSLDDERFKDKVVVVQIMGTWCPNCLDESKYYSNFYKTNKDKDIEFVALAFEYAKTEELALKRIDRLQSKVGINYPILLAQHGTADKAKAQEKLPMLNHVLSYPTSIFIDKKGNVRKIHTGFNGPATGDKYVEFKAEFEGFIAELLAE